jgi:hypothetical protein
MRDPQGRAKRLRLVLYDDSKVRLLEEAEIAPLPAELQETTPFDDLYLVETAFSVRPTTLVTTDGHLRDVVNAGDWGIHGILVEDYLGLS